MTAKQLLDALTDALDSGAVDPTDYIHLHDRKGKVIPFHEFDAENSHRYTAERYELRADAYVLATTEK